ncbi:MAG TPA: hypothetical protein VG826_29205 [Pirellulales bacterium]|nr:hypothetical protein [Pirellulales bacterium]
MTLTQLTPTITDNGDGSCTVVLGPYAFAVWLTDLAAYQRGANMRDIFIPLASQALLQAGVDLDALTAGQLISVASQATYPEPP